MSILIKGVKMPENCGECLFFGLESAGNGMYWDYCNAIRSVLYDADNSVSEDCPLVELPPHGRLIDGDALAYSEKCKKKGCAYQEEIFNAPTIIEAEENNG